MQPADAVGQRPSALATSLGCAWPRVLNHSKDAMRRIGLIAIRQSSDWDHPKDIHSNLVAHCKVNGGWPVVHSKDEIRLARPLGLRPKFTLDGHPKASITETNG